MPIQFCALIKKLNDCIRNATAVCNSRQNSVQDKIQSEKKNFVRKKIVGKKFLLEKIILSEKVCLRFCLGLTVVKVSCLGQIDAYHHKEVCTHHNKNAITYLLWRCMKHTDSV